MARPAVAWFEVTGEDGAALQFAFFADPEGHVVGLSHTVAE